MLAQPNKTDCYFFKNKVLFVISMVENSVFLLRNKNDNRKLIESEALEISYGNLWGYMLDLCMQKLSLKSKFGNQYPEMIFNFSTRTLQCHQNCEFLALVRTRQNSDRILNYLTKSNKITIEHSKNFKKRENSLNKNNQNKIKNLILNRRVSADGRWLWIIIKTLRFVFGFCYGLLQIFRLLMVLFMLFVYRRLVFTHNLWKILRSVNKIPQIRVMR